MRYGVAGLTYLDNNGEPLSGGKLYFYETGTTTPKDTYSDSAETIANTNPVLLDAAGRQPDIFFSGYAKIVIKTSADVQIDSSDPVGEAAVSGAFTLWVVTTEYNLGDTVTGPDGKFYQSLTSGNIGNNPSISPTNWVELKYVYNYNAAKSFEAADIALSAGVLYLSLVGTNLNNPPESSPTQWMPLNTAVWQDMTVKTADFTATTGRYYLLNTAGGAFTMTLPASPASGDEIGLTDYSGTFGTYNLTCGRNGSNILASATDLVCDISYFSTVLIYTTGKGWIFR
jgi:hypothetical protein